MSLTHWQNRLASHFEALARRRAETGWPVFALEHGLSSMEVDALEDSVRESLRAAPPRKTEYLPWVVYSAEFGYRYAGDEYWQSFVAETRGWNDRWREFIRDAFVRFANRYHGARPEGAWASNFTIISWPITHGVLPKDLQKQLARVLYEARYGLRPELFSSAAALGKHLRSLSHDASSRFREFAENTLLLGQIAAALLVQEPGEEQLISSATLERLIEDINEERASREWLREARTSAQRLRVRGLSTRGTPAPTPPLGSPAITPSQRDPAAQIGSFGIEPRFLLRPAAADTWDVALEVPDLAPLLRQYPHLRDTLARSSGRVAGSANRVIARGRLVQGGAQRFVLSSWPGPDQPLITFDRAKAELRLLLESVFRTPPGDSWLFRVGSDGQAFGLKARIVHPGNTYILLQRQEVHRPVQGFNKLTVTCDGVHALQFDVPSHVDGLWETLLAKLNLQCSKTLRVWPAGLSPASWDEVGHGEWLVGDETILGVEIDHALRSLDVSLDGGQPQSFRVSLGPNGGRLFVSLGCLSEGQHRAVLQTSRHSSQSDELRGYLDFQVRAPRAPASGKSAQQALMLATFPSSPTLEDLWDGRLELQLSGPPGTGAECTVMLKERDGGQPLFTKRLPQQALPIEPTAWQSVFKNHFRKERNAELSYDAANQCRVEFDAGPVGCVVLTVDREFTPLRWGVRNAGEKTLARLFDDTGGAGVSVVICDFRTPTTSRALAYDTAIEGLPVEFPGGLFVANSGDRAASAVIVPPRKHLQLSDLSITPAVPAVRRDSLKLTTFLRIASQWENARLKGSALGPAYQQYVLKAIMAAVFGVAGGENWARAERQYLNDPIAGLRAMKGLISDSPSERSLGPAIAYDVEPLARLDSDGRVAHFARLARTYLKGLEAAPAVGTKQSFTSNFTKQIADAAQMRDLCEFALRASSSPGNVLVWCGEETEAVLARLLARPAVARAARFAVLTVDQLMRSKGVDTGTTYAGWTW